MPAPLHANMLRAIVTFAVAVTISAAAAACDGGDDAATSSPGADDGTPAATATPTPAPGDIALADELRDEGAFEDAINVYAAVVASSQSSGERQEARLEQARLLTRTRRFDEARTTLEAYVADAGAAVEGTAAQFMLASTLDDIADPDGALAQYERYIAAGGAASSYAEIERAKMLARLGRSAEAEAAAEAVLNSPLDGVFKASFVLSLARAFDKAGDGQAALAWYTRATQTPGADVAEALTGRGALKQRIGDPTWTGDYLTVVNSYGDSAAAPLEALDAAGVTVGSYARGYVFYRAFRNADARVALTLAATSGDAPAAATYYLAALDEREGNLPAAIDGYGRAQQLDPASFLADDALWWRARLLEQAGRYNEAVATYALFDFYPESSWSADARFHQGLASYRAGDYAAAATVWSAISSEPAGEDNDEERLRARFWHARALIAANDDDAGERELEQLRNDAPADFYALRAEVLLGDNERRDGSLDLDAGEPDWSALEDFVRDALAPEVTPAPEATPDPATPAPVEVYPSADVRWPEVDELLAVGLRAQADFLVREIIGDYAFSPPALLEITRTLHDDDRASAAARAAVTLIASLPDSPDDPPLDLLRIAYPSAFASLVEDTASEQDVPSLLLLSLMRQESFYDPDAGSPAGALGLTQVIPATGEQIAGALDIASFAPTDLFRPRVSLRFGANYLASQLAAFDANPYYALAAYNGGPGAASGAIDAAGDDVDLFVEDLEFDETRLYVKLVMENYARYRQLYEHLRRPSLPE
ncbi:MAG: transglycosylase SLT domain-containing protein [Dehalococcoidia bacterium]